MVRDGVANIVDQASGIRFRSRKIGPDSWESRCPAHRSADSLFHHPQRAQSCFARVPECGELPAYSNHPCARFYERTCVRGNRRLVDQPAQAAFPSSPRRLRAPARRGITGLARARPKERMDWP